jgi:hypothetical protein
MDCNVGAAQNGDMKSVQRCTMFRSPNVDAVKNIPNEIFSLNMLMVGKWTNESMSSQRASVASYC